MKINKILSLVLGLSALASSCTVNEIHDQELPAGEYVRLTLSGGDGTTANPAQATRATWDDPTGKGSLGFKWEEVTIDSDETDELLVVLSNGTDALVNKATPEATGSDLTYTGMAVTPGVDPHLANFETVRYYATNHLSSAKYVYAVAGGADITVDNEGKKHVCKIEMPSSFAQAADQDPSFLRDYMYLYGTAEYNVNSSTRLKFKHIPATFRFIITNGTENDMSFKSVSVSVVEGGAVASKTADVTFAWAANNAELSFGEETYETVTTVLPDNGVTVQKGQKYTTYSLVLPLASNEAFAGKVIRFIAKTSDGKNLTYLLEGATLANANGANSGIYNWVGGKSYTIKFNIGDGGKTSGTMLSNKDITVATTVGGSFTLKYVDASGNPLENYADICTMSVADMATYEDFIDANIAPYAADAIAIYDEADVKVGTIAINGIKADKSGLLYSIGMLSDVHLNTQNSYYSDSFTDFDSALKFFNSSDVNVAFTCTCGDISENGIESEFARYQEIVAANSSAPVYTTTGNHDAQSGIDEDLWRQYTGHGLVYEVSKTVNGKTDHFLFLGMSAWNFAEAYNEANLMWLRSRLELYKNERCFVITHLFFPDGAGNMLEIYPEGNWLRGLQLNELKELSEKYVNSIWFSGHSHWKWSLQKFEDNANIHKHQGAGWGVHIPSCAKPSDSDGNPGSSNARQEKKDQSEGAVINVYENYIDVLGVDFITGKYLPIATYRLDTTLEEVEDEPLDETILTADKFTYYKGTGEMSITDVEDMPGYIDVIFTGNGQGYYVKNSTFTEGHDSDNQVFDLEFDYLQCWTGWGTSSQAEVATIDRVGFYSGDYNLVNTVNCYVDPIHGVQFQTKSNCDAAFPIKIRMKARGKFYLKDENQASQGVELTAADFVYNEGKKPGATITDAGGGYIEAIFTGVSQGFWMTNSTFTLGYDTDYQPVDISISGLQCWTGWGTSDQKEVSTIDYVGFYSGSYNLASTDKCYVDANYGVQFQTSSSCKGPFPIKIRMKAKAYFNLKSDAPSQYISASDFAINPVKVNKNDDITTYVSDVDGMPGYVDVKFTAASQGYFITHTTHSSSTKKVDVVIEEAKALDENGAEMSMPANVGFYGYLSSNTTSQTYNMGENLSFVSLPAEGVAFQTSSQCPGPYPFTIRMKVKTTFHQ